MHNPGAAGEEGDSLKSFHYAIKAKQTKERYRSQLGYFLSDFLKIPGDSLEQQAATWLALYWEKGIKWANDCLIDYVTYLKGRVDDGEITGGTVGNYYGVVKLFYDVNDIELNWKKIERGLPETGAIANDRAPTVEEIRKIIQYPDRRIRVIVLVMVSSGIRLGAWESLKLKHLSPIYSPQNDKVIIAAKLVVYEGRPKPYHTYVTPEAYQAVQDYVAFRKLHGENVTPESWILRDKFETTGDNKYYLPGQTIGLATAPQKLQVSGIKKILIRAMRSQGIRQNLENGAKRYPFKLAHGYRKFFLTNASRVMLADNVAKLADHKLPGMRPHYIRFTESELLADYLKAVDYLTIDKDHKMATQLQKQVTVLTEKTEEQNYIIEGRLAQKDREMQELREYIADSNKRFEHMMLDPGWTLKQLKKMALLMTHDIITDDNNDNDNEGRNEAQQ